MRCRTLVIADGRAWKAVETRNRPVAARQWAHLQNLKFPVGRDDHIVTAQDGTNTHLLVLRIGVTIGGEGDSSVLRDANCYARFSFTTPSGVAKKVKERPHIARIGNSQTVKVPTGEGGRSLLCVRLLHDGHGATRVVVGQTGLAWRPPRGPPKNAPLHATNWMSHSSDICDVRRMEDVGELGV